MNIEQRKKHVVEELQRLAAGFLSEALDESLDSEQRQDACGAYLETIARLAAAGGSVSETSLPPELVRAAIDALDGDGLAGLADELFEIIESTIEDPFDDEAIEEARERAEWILLQRDSFESRLEGARMVDPGISPPEGVLEGIRYFDETIRPMAWALSLLNEKRQGHAAVVDLERRKDRWWWSEAVGVEWETITRADEFAELLERYPTFANYMERLREAARIRLAASGQPGSPATAQAERREGEGAKVIDLVRMLASRTQQQRQAMRLPPEKVQAIRSWRPAAAAASAAGSETIHEWKAERGSWRANLWVPAPSAAEDKAVLSLTGLPTDARAVLLFGRPFEIKPEQGRARIRLDAETLSAIASEDMPAVAILRAGSDEPEPGVSG